MIDKIVDSTTTAYNRVEVNVDRMLDECGNIYYHIKHLSKNNIYYHRYDGPAFEAGNGNKEWWQYNKRHRINGPAVDRADRKEWWQNGLRHRLGGPAIEHANFIKEWWHNGKLHRLDGPAVECFGTSNYFWCYDGEHIDCNSQEEFENSKQYRKYKLRAFL